MKNSDPIANTILNGCHCQYYAMTSAAIGTTATVALYSSAAASVAASAIGTGLSMYSQQQQAKSAQDIANYNYAQQQQNARVNAAMATQQAQWQQQLAASKQQAALNNAAALNDQARATEAQAREQARRTRDENERGKAMQRARYAKAGVTSEGSPLTIMSETSGLMELGIQGSHYQADMEARALDRQADLERYQSEFSAFDAGVARYEEAASQAGLALDLNQARIERSAGYATAQGYRNASYGTLLSGIGDAAQTAAGGYDRAQTAQVAKSGGAAAKKPAKYTGTVGSMLY